MKKIFSVLLLILVSGTGLYSQKVSVGFSTGLGTYSMSELKSLNEAIKPSFDAKLVSDFPPYIYFQYLATIDEDDYSFGLTYTFQSTGSRISAKDYSGEYYLDMNVGSYNAGIYGGIKLLSGTKQRFSGYVKAGMAFSNLKINQYLNVSNTVLSNNTTAFKALAAYFEPGISYSYSLTPSLGIGLNAGYSLQLGGRDFHLKGEKDHKLVNLVTREPVKPKWQGFRMGITVMYHLKPNE